MNLEQIFFRIRRSVAFLIFLSSSAVAQVINFDTPSSVPCKDVTPAQFKTNNPNGRIIEVRFKITADLSIEEDTLAFIRYKIAFPTNCVVQDYLPKTTLDSSVAAPIQIESEASQSSGYQISANAGASVNYVVGSGGGGIGGGYNSSKTANSSVQISYLPPQQVVMAVGTANRDSAIWWKLEPMNQVTLDGEKEFAVLLKVPANWQDSCAELMCSRKLQGDDEICMKDMWIGLYPDGNTNLKRKAEKDAKNQGENEINESANNLKQISLALRKWENEDGHENEYPWNLSQKNGGTLELCDRDNDGFERNPVPIFKVLYYHDLDLENPQILYCPGDSAKQPTSDFANLTKNNISYRFRTGPNVSETYPEEIMAVDPIHNIQVYADGSVAVSTNSLSP
jgi:hypothetical protein